MRHLKHMTLAILLAFSLAASTFAAEVPESLVVENLNGQQRIVKTYVLPPDADPQVLKEPSFDYDGYTYTWAYTTKEEQTYLETKSVTETKTVETAKDELTDILAQLSPSISYDDGEYSGELALDHTTLSTAASGYTTKYSTVKDVKTIGPLDRNDMSYVPATTVKNGKTLKLASVDWQIIGTDQVSGTLVPCSYQAVATYSATSSYQAATGYVTTAEYKGTVTAEGVESVTYTVVYTGAEIIPEGTDVQSVESPAAPDKSNTAPANGILLPILAVLAQLLLLAGGAMFLFKHYKNVSVYAPGELPRDYELIAKFRVEPASPRIDISGLHPYPTGVIAIEIKPSLSKKLVDKEFTVHHKGGDYAYTVLQSRVEDWHEFSLASESEDTP